VNLTLIEALIAAAGAIIGAMAALFIQSRRLPSDIRLAEAQADKLGYEGSALVIASLASEVARLKQDMTDVRAQLARAADRDHRRARHMGEMLAEIMGNLLDCSEDPTRAQSVDRAAVTRMTKFIIDSYVAEITIGAKPNGTNNST